MENLLEETIGILNKHNLKIEDAKYIGSTDIKLSVEQFKQLANVNYNNDYGWQQMPTDIKIYFDNFIFFREETEGAEYWRFVNINIPNGDCIELINRCKFNNTLDTQPLKNHIEAINKED